MPGDTSYEEWTLCVAIIAMVVNAGLFWLLRDQIKQGARATALDHDQRRMQATLEFITATSARAAEFKDIPALTHEAVDPFIVEPMPRERGEMIRLWLNVYEGLATGVNMGLYDLELTERVRGAAVVRIWELYKPWIVESRNALSLQTLYCEIESLAKTIQDRQTKKGRRIAVV